MADERETFSERLRSGYIAPSSSEFHVCITGTRKENYLRIVLLFRSYFQNCDARAPAYFAHPTFAIAKIGDYSQSSGDMNFKYFIDPARYPASRVALDLEKDWRRLCSQDTTANFLKQRQFWVKWQVRVDNDYSITKRLFIHLITFYSHSVRSVLASFSLPCSWQGKVNVHQSVVNTTK